MRRIVWVVMLILALGIDIVQAQSPARAPITAGNANRVTQVAMLGKGRIYNMEWSQDGRTLAVATSAGVWLYDGRANLPSTISRQFDAYKFSAYDVTLTPDGSTLIVFNSQNPGLYFYDLKTSEVLNVMVPERHVAAAALSGDGKKLAALRFQPTLLTVWDRDTQQESAVFEVGRNAKRVELNADGSRMLVSRSANNFDQESWIEVWNADTYRMPFYLKGHIGSVWDITFSPDSTLAASAGQDGTARIWDLATGENLQVLQADSREAWSVAFSPDGSLLASGGEDGVLRLWDVETGEERAMIHDDLGLPIWEIAFSPDGERLAYASTSISFWNYKEGESAVRQIAGDHMGSILKFEFHPEGKTLAAYGVKSVQVWDMQTLNLRGALSYLSSDSFYLRVTSPDGTKTAVVSRTTDDNIIVLGNLRLTGHTGRIWDVAFSMDGRRLVSSAKDNTLRVWDTTTGEQVSVIQADMVGSGGVAFSPDGTKIASTAMDFTAHLWDVANGEKLADFIGHTKYLNDLAFSPDGTVLASAADNALRLWDVRSGESLAVLEGHKSWVSEVHFSPDGTYLASGSEDGTIRLWGVPES